MSSWEEVNVAKSLGSGLVPPPSQDCERQPDALLDEWRECRESLRAFDKIIVDLRKYGFSLITILIGANGILFSQKGIGSFALGAIYLALLLLIVALFRIDRTHHVFIRSTVMRALVLEERSLKRTGQLGLTAEIAHWSETVTTATWGIVLYMLFCFAAYALAVGSVLDRGEFSLCEAESIIFYLTIAGFSMTVAVLVIHERSSDLSSSFGQTLDAVRPLIGRCATTAPTPGALGRLWRWIWDRFVFRFLMLVLVYGTVLAVSNWHIGGDFFCLHWLATLQFLS